ncbi:DUF2917 domain-containing protein [Polaromonas sp.]|uniref:DUF2917 domain-containing protein n=1 Tax=Polaromonas sp. TaxID=1869339 RepID=UPI003CBB1F3F
MNDLELHVLDSSAATRALSGCWKLGDGQALTLRPVQPGVLRIARGRVWLTFDHARHDDGVRGGDHFLDAGDTVRLLPGQALVMESWRTAQQSAAYFSWDPLPANEGVTISTRSTWAFAGGPQWRASVLQPLRDLRLALGLAGSASTRLGAGLAVTLARALLLLAPRFAMDAAAARSRPAGK